MPALNPPKITPDHVRERLRKGQSVDLEAPGWSDTGATHCPACGRYCQQFHVEPGLLFHYGSAVAYRHECQGDEPAQQIPAWLRADDARAQVENEYFRMNRGDPNG